MGLGSTISRGFSVAGSSNYEPCHRSGSASTRYAMASSTSQPSIVRASTITSATSTSQFMRSPSISREGSFSSIGSTVRPPTVASKASRSSTLRTSIMSSAISTSKLIRSASTASSLYPPTSAPATSSISLHRSASKRAPSHFSTAASRFFWGRPPPSHSTLLPSQISALTYTLSLPVDTPMLSSVVGALGVPSRSQFSPPPSCFCDAHFWFEQKYIDELTEVIAHEIGPQLDKLRMAPKELISKKTARLLSILQPYQDIFASITDTSSIASMKPNCPACTLSQFFQNPEAVNALSISVKGRKYRSHPWPASMAWLEPCPGKGVDWEAKWRTEGKSVGYDRVRVQRWRRENHLHEQVSEAPPQAPGHQPGEGCDFCDSLRMERADEAELDAAIAEEEDRGADDVYVDARDETTAADDDDEAESLRFSDPETLRAQAETDSDGSSTLRDSDSETLRALTEESIIKAYLTSPSKPKTTPTTKPRKTSSIYDNASQQHHPSEKVTAQQGMKKQRMLDHLAHMGENEDAGGRQERARRASDWGRSYRHLVGRGPESQTTLQFERYPEPDSSGPELWAVEGLF